MMYRISRKVWTLCLISTSGPLALLRLQALKIAFVDFISQDGQMGHAQSFRVSWETELLGRCLSRQKLSTRIFNMKSKKALGPTVAEFFKSVYYPGGLFILVQVKFTGNVGMVFCQKPRLKTREKCFVRSKIN